MREKKERAMRECSDKQHGNIHIATEMNRHNASFSNMHRLSSILTPKCSVHPRPEKFRQEESRFRPPIQILTNATPVKKETKGQTRYRRTHDSIGTKPHCRDPTEPVRRHPSNRKGNSEQTRVPAGNIRLIERFVELVHIDVDVVLQKAERISAHDHETEHCQHLQVAEEQA